MGNFEYLAEEALRLFLGLSVIFACFAFAAQILLPGDISAARFNEFALDCWALTGASALVLAFSAWRRRRTFSHE